jgi:hypothetical protein
LKLIFLKNVKIKGGEGEGVIKQGSPRKRKAKTWRFPALYGAELCWVHWGIIMLGSFFHKKKKKKKKKKIKKKEK